MMSIGPLTTSELLVNVHETSTSNANDKSFSLELQIANHFLF